MGDYAKDHWVNDLYLYLIGYRDEITVVFWSLWFLFGDENLPKVHHG